MNAKHQTPDKLSPQIIRWHPFADAAAVRDAALETIATAATQAIQARGAFHLVLAGGSTPKAVYQLCKTLTTDWTAWHIYHGDERCLPADHPDRNSRMATEAWLAHVPIPAAQIHDIPAENGAVAAAEAYSEALRDIGEFDLVLLGLGEDGHTASLFPGQTAGLRTNAPDAVPVFDAPKPPPSRVSLCARRLAQTRQTLFMVTGSEKLTAVRQWTAGADIPARFIRPAGGVDVFCEASLLKTSG